MVLPVWITTLFTLRIYEKEVTENLTTQSSRTLKWGIVYIIGHQHDTEKKKKSQWALQPNSEAFLVSELRNPN